MLRTLVALLLVGAVLVGCGSGGGGNTEPTPEGANSAPAPNGQQAPDPGG
jgi:hypothetical protein